MSDYRKTYATPSALRRGWQMCVCEESLAGSSHVLRSAEDVTLSGFDNADPVKQAEKSRKDFAEALILRNARETIDKKSKIC